MPVRRLDPERDELVTPVEPGQQTAPQQPTQPGAQPAPQQQMQPAPQQPTQGGGVRRLNPETDELVQATPDQQDPGMMQNFLDAVGDVNTGMIRPFGPGAMNLAQKAGIVPDTANEPPKSVSQGARRMAGEAMFTGAAMAFPFLRGNQMRLESQRFLNAMTSGSVGTATALREGLRKTAETVARRPGATLGMEGVAGAGAGATGTAIQQEGGSASQQLFGELVGGVGTSGAVSGAVAASRIAPVAAYTRSVIRALREGSVEGIAPTQSRARAAGRTQRALDRPAESVTQEADEADVLPGLSLAERSGEEGLLRLERSVYDQTEELSRQHQEHFTEINQAILRSLRETPDQMGEVEATPQDARAYLDGLVATRLDQATAVVQDKLQQLGPRATRETANRLARQEIEKALNVAMDQERDLWENVPGELTAPLANSQDTMQTILNTLAGDRVRRTQAIIPARLRTMLGRLDPETGEYVPGELGEAATVNEIRSLRDEIRRAATAERARPSPNGTRLHYLNQLNESLLADLDTLGAEAGDALDLARGFSRDLNARFRKGDVGRILGHTTEGGERVPEGLTLEATIGRSGAPGREAADRALEAASLRLNDSSEPVGDVQALRGHMADFIRDEFRRAAAPDGELDVRSAQRYINKRSDLLSRFPELREEIDQAIEAGDFANMTQAMLDPRKSRAAVFLGRDLDQAMRNLIRDSNAPEAAKQMRQMLGEDPTGRALEGARRALTETLITESRASGTGDLEDTAYVSGKQLRDLLNNPRMQAISRELLTDEQRNRLQTITNTALRMDRARSAIPAQEGVLGDRPGWAARKGAQVLGAIGGRWLARWTGGGSVQMPGIGSNALQELQRKGLDPAQMIVVDAVTRPDDRLFRALMMDISDSPRREKIVRDRLNAWALTVAAEHGIRIAGQEQQNDGEQRGQF